MGATCETNPYLITGPALISFSGGRTSAYMLYRILQAHGGTLPDDVHVCFANTGKEREETLRFVHDCSVRWGVRVRWLEWRSRLKRTPVGERFEEVGYNSAARSGEPFERLIADKGTTPNAVRRFCTEHLKTQICHDFMEAHGYPRWKNIIGLRRDEQRRVLKKAAQNVEENNPWRHVMPLDTARVKKADVLAFWAEQPFDLGLMGWEGNCDLCFLKARSILSYSIRREPELAQWWDRMEKTIGKGRFVTEWSVAQLVEEVRCSPLMPLEPGDDDEFDAECGLWCAGEAA